MDDHAKKKDGDGAAYVTQDEEAACFPSVQVLLADIRAVIPLEDGGVGLTENEDLQNCMWLMSVADHEGSQPL